MKYCPDWLFSAIAALIAQRFLSSALGLDAYARRYAEVLAKYYAEIPPEMLEYAAEGYLRHLSEAEADNAYDILDAFAFQRVCTDGQGNKRRMRRMFGSELEGKKVIEYGAEKAIKDFKPFIYMLRLKPELAPPAGWNWALIEDGEWLTTLPDLEVSLFDGL